MSPTMAQAVSIAKLAQALYTFLPGSNYGKATTFATVASSVGVEGFWCGGSKQPAIETLLSRTLDECRDRFCPLMETIMFEGIKYRHRKKDPVTREEVKALNQIIQELKFKIPSLWDPMFLDSLPSRGTQTGSPAATSTGPTADALMGLEKRFLQLHQQEPHRRGYEFQNFLHDLFGMYGFNPRPSFALVGEQIDGSIVLDHETYLVEAKWQQNPVAKIDLVALDDKVHSHSRLGRGIFISAGSFSEDGVTAFGKGRSIIGVNGQDLYFIIHEHLPLDEVLRRKVRWLVETGEFHYAIGRFKESITTGGRIRGT
jgi:hypothetical protein